MNESLQKNYDYFISIIVPVYNGGDEIIRLLDNLSQQDYSSDKFEIIVVDDGSTDGTPENIKQQFPAVIVCQQHRGGSYSARNTGSKKAKGELFAFIDADCIPPVDWLSTGIKSMLEKQVDLLAGDVNMVFDDQQSVVENYDACFGINQKFYVEQCRFGVTANLLVKREAFKKIGGFDDELYSGGDQKFCNEAVSLGFKLSFCEKAKIDHPCRRKLKELTGKTKRVAKGRAMAFPSKGYYVPRALVIFPENYFFWKKAAKNSKPTIGFYLLHYYLELIRVFSYAKARLAIRSQH